MATQQILFIAVPNGLRTVDGTQRARVSVFISPRLRLDGPTLTGDFINWPDCLRVKGASFRVHFGNVSKQATIVQQTAPQLWAALFDSNTFVRTHTPDGISGLVCSYPTARLCDLIKTIYQDTFVDAPLEPPTETLPSALAPILPLFEKAPSHAVDDTGGSDDDARARLAREVFRPSSEDELRAKLNRLVDLAGSEANRRRGEAVTPPSIEIIPDVDDPAIDLARFLLFHRHASGTSPFAADAPSDKRIDFHQQLANLGEYPALQRRLGLIIDLDVDLADVPLSTSGHDLLRVEPRFTISLSPAATLITPDTAYTLTSNMFLPAAGAPSPREIVDGLLNLGLTIGPDTDTPQFRLIQLGVDAAGFDAIALLKQAAAGGGPQPRAGLAPLRSSGVSIVRYGNGRFLMDAIGIGLMKMERIVAGESGIALFAEDLIRGYRIDVRHGAGGAWSSLHRRDGVYRFTATGNKSLLIDEGFLQPSMVQPGAAATASTTLAAAVPNYVAESLFLWHGWSLAAPRPAAVMPQPPSTESALEPVSEVKLDTTFTATAGSLPRLRFGDPYEFRVRLVDLIGGGLTSQQADAQLSTFPTPPVLPKPGQEFRYLRFEVVPSPVILPRVKPGLGSEVDRVVLRSNHDVTPDGYAERHPEVPEYVLSGERHIVAPKGWQLLAEATGLFDSSIGSGAGLDGTFALLKRATAALGDDEVHPEPAVSIPYLPDPLADGVALRNLPGVPQGVVGRVDSGQLKLGGALPDGPGPLPESVVTVRFDGEWPDLKGFRIRLREGSGVPQWDAAQRVLSVFLPKGVARTIGISSTLKDESALGTLGIWDWLTDRLDQLVRDGRMDEKQRASRQARLRELSMLGQSWMLTPPRELRLTHAVQQPVDKPVIERLELVRLPGSTHALINAVIGVHGATTGQIELRWRGDSSSRLTARAPVLKTPFVLPPVGESSPAPEPGKPLPVAAFDAGREKVSIFGPDVTAIERDLKTATDVLLDDWKSLLDLANAAVPFDRPVRDMIRNARSDVLVVLHGFDSGTTIERWSSAARAGRLSQDTAEAFIGFPEPSPSTLENPNLRVVAVGIAGDPAAGLPGDALNLVAAATKARDSLAGFTARHDFGDTKYRRVTYQAVATTRFGDCFPSAPASALDVTRISDDTVVEVLNTATPPPPRIDYVVPAFSWKRQGSVAEEFSSERSGGGLRVYLDGAWFLSGEGELLGVAVPIIPEAGVVQFGNTLVETNWARDPLWDTQSPRHLPAKASFRDAQRVFESILLPDQPRQIVTIVGYPVKVDESGRHYSDVVLDPAGSYFPFVRLALTRFQPNSVRGMESSPVVLTDFVQLTPKRGVTVQRQEPLVLQVAVSGLTHQSATDPTVLGASDRVGTRVRVTVQQRIAGTADDAGWLPEAAAVDLQAGSQTWTGTVRIPSRPPGSLRLLIEEIEDHAARQSAAEPVSRERIVFAETVPV